MFMELTFLEMYLSGDVILLSRYQRCCLSLCRESISNYITDYYKKNKNIVHDIKIISIFASQATLFVIFKNE